MHLPDILVLVCSFLSLLPNAVDACGDGNSCYGPISQVQHVRHIKRMQPGALNASYGPRGPLEWGQINFLHTTDTHGWLQGHLREQNFGADWGDFVTFTHRMKQKARELGVDLLLVDTGDLHDGTGLADATEIDGTATMPIFDAIDYDLLAIGNHELYQSDVSYEMFHKWARKWGDKYLTSNVKILNKASGQFEYLGVTHRYFTTEKGLRIMAFGVLFDFTGNSNASQIIKAEDMVKESWFVDALATDEPVDLFLILGHNPVRQTDERSTLRVVFDAIRAVHAHTPIQIFGGHAHIRDFDVYDDASVAMASGCYCETLGWASVSGFGASTKDYRGPAVPRGVKTASRPARPGSLTPYLFSRRYLDWNRKTFVYHTTSDDTAYDNNYGKCISNHITKVREQMRLGEVYGCAPQSWCRSCAPFGDKNNIISGLFGPAFSAVVVNQSRAEKPRIILSNTALARFDLHKGPFTRDDVYITVPFINTFRYLPDVPFTAAKQLIAKLIQGRVLRRDLETMSVARDDCMDPMLGYMDPSEGVQSHGVVRRQEAVVPGYVTTDDWGTDGDDTEHSTIPSYEIPPYWEARAKFPDDGSDPDKVDVVFTEYIGKLIVEYLGKGYNKAMVQCYLDCENFSSQDVLRFYARMFWQDNKDNCPVM